MLLFSTKMYLLLTILLTKMLHMSRFFLQRGKCPRFFLSSHFSFDQTSYHEEILGCEMQPVVVLVVPILIKDIFQCYYGQILIYQKLRAVLNGMYISV